MLHRIPDLDKPEQATGRGECRNVKEAIERPKGKEFDRIGFNSANLLLPVGDLIDIEASSPGMYLPSARKHQTLAASRAIMSRSWLELIFVTVHRFRDSTFGIKDKEGIEIPKSSSKMLIPPSNC